MEIISSLLCDAAEDYQGKLCVLGAFDTFVSLHFPVSHPHCAIALRVIFRPGDEGQHQLRVRLIDSDGHCPVPEIQTAFEVPPLPEEVFFLSRNIIVNLQGLPFAAPGQFSLDVMSEEGLLARIPIQALQAPEEMRTPGL
ncbi:hypothetical protein SAMN05444156_1820 [Verrucomicrobium sp. GAS474]|uniref:DUF6941 family protein n=1 Tax=Verrucomicrobium sp. GAS474 TaxID=1882831 RepID=UPI0008799F2E|nr:hypothetical protein [Verrucomicrobium sp. GAS474]SDU07628.1 hypothetical protein SAMN05444156_1820 [Verrucomicrobium sp. GAS474]